MSLVHIFGEGVSIVPLLQMGRPRHGGLRSFDEREAEKDLSVRRMQLTTPKLCHGLASCFFGFTKPFVK